MVGQGEQEVTGSPPGTPAPHWWPAAARSLCSAGAADLARRWNAPRPIFWGGHENLADSPPPPAPGAHSGGVAATRDRPPPDQCPVRHDPILPALRRSLGRPRYGAAA